MIPGSGFVAPPPPPPPNGLGPPRRRERSSRLVCDEASQHALHVYIDTHRLYIHTYILTNKYIHTPIHACTYRHAPPTHRGAGHTIDTHIHTYIQIHTYIHTCMYIQTRPPNPQGGAGGRPLVPPTYKNLCTQTLWGGGGGWGLQPWTIYICSTELPGHKHTELRSTHTMCTLYPVVITCMSIYFANLDPSRVSAMRE